MTTRKKIPYSIFDDVGRARLNQMAVLQPPKFQALGMASMFNGLPYQNDAATWQTKDGRRIPIKHMETAHILSAVAMVWQRSASVRFGLAQNDATLDQWMRNFPVLLAELESRK